MFNKIVRDKAPIFLEHVPDWIITKQQLKIMGDHSNNIWFIKSGMKVIKNARHRKQKWKKNSYLLHGIPIVRSCDGLVYVKRWKTRDTKIEGMQIQKMLA